MLWIEVRVYSFVSIRIRAETLLSTCPGRFNVDAGG